MLRGDASERKARMVVSLLGNSFVACASVLCVDDNIADERFEMLRTLDLVKMARTTGTGFVYGFMIIITLGDLVLYILEMR